jgi:hypothetical protein
MEFGGYSVAADVGCAVYSLQTKRGYGQEEWTMRDKIPVLVCLYDMKCQFLPRRPGMQSKRREHGWRVRHRLHILSTHGAHRRLGMALALGSAPVYDASKSPQTRPMRRGSDDQALVGTTSSKVDRVAEYWW